MKPSSSTLPTLSPVLRLADPAQAIAFYIAVFSAAERYRLVDPKSGRIAHAELQLGDSVLMLTSGPGETDAAPGTTTVPRAQLSLGVTDVDAVTERARRHGATILKPPTDQFYGYRCANLRDPFGAEWMLSQRREELSPSEMQERWNRLSSQ